jgi:DNA-binding response OmpR family regulator
MHLGKPFVASMAVLALLAGPIPLALAADLLRVMLQHAGKVLTHRLLLKELWDEMTDA